jgi:23S rRNA (adenine2503-C2)-methyltransferase
MSSSDSTMGSTPGSGPQSAPQPEPAGFPSLVGLMPEEIGRLPALAGSPGYRARQVAVWVYRKGARGFDDMSTLSKPLRAGLAQVCSLERMPCVATRVSADVTTLKFLFATRDGRRIEAVLIRAPRRDTICISTQVGCSFGCRFCATAAMGWQRNLTRHEIVSQVLALRDELRRLGGRGFFNVVFMGMGEPLANYAELVATLHVLQSDFGMGIGRRRMTVSTVGLPEEIRQLAREPVSVRLALSLNATDNETRSRLMPVNRRHPIETLLPALAEYRALTGQRVTLEYVLLHELNDTREDAHRLARLATQVGCGINLIRYNPHPLSDLMPSTAERVDAFRLTLLPIAPAVTLRESRGDDILAACGQLSTAYDAGGACGANGGTPPRA